MNDPIKGELRTEAVDPQVETREEAEANIRHLEQIVPWLCHSMGTRTFRIICDSLEGVLRALPADKPFMLERNVQKDGAFIYVGTHTFDVVAELRRQLGVTHGTVERLQEQVAAEVMRAREEREERKN